MDLLLLEPTCRHAPPCNTLCFLMQGSKIDHTPSSGGPGQLLTANAESLPLVP